jgi:uroporphyrinogen decarboxylase
MNDSHPSPRENLLRTLRRQGFDRVPVDPNAFCPDQCAAFKTRFGHEDVEGFFESPVRMVGCPMRATHADGLALYPREQLPPDATIDAWGVAHSHRPGCWHMTHMHHPLAGEEVTLGEIERHPLPAHDETAMPGLRAHIAALHARGLAAMGGMACTVWERAWYLRSMEDLMTDMMLDDPRATRLLDRVTDHACRTIEAFARAGADIAHLGDDIGMQSTPMMAVELWRAWLKPRLARVIAAGRTVKPDLLVFYHSCGHVTPFIPDLIDAGVDILNPVQPESMDLADALRLSGGRLAFWGTIGTQRVLPFGTPDEVRDAVRRNLELCGPRGGIVIGPTHMVEPEVPWENLLAMRDAAAAYSTEP